MQHLGGGHYVSGRRTLEGPPLDRNADRLESMLAASENQEGVMIGAGIREGCLQVVDRALEA